MKETDKELEDLPGVGPATADNLRDAGYTSIQALTTANPDELAGVENVGEDTAENAVFTAMEWTGMMGFNTGSEVLAEERDKKRLKWGIDEIDDVYGGGFKPGSMNEIFGPFSSGKSQIAMYFCIRVQLSEQDGGLSGRAVFVDTEQTFVAQRVEEMIREGLSDEVKQREMDRRGIEGSPDDADAMEELVQDFLDKILHKKALNSIHQRSIVKNEIQKAGSEYEDSDWPVRYIAIDSLMAHFRAEFVGRGELAGRQQKLSKHLIELEHVMNQFDAVALCTNQVSANPDKFFGDPNQAIGGNIVGHKMETRLKLKKSSGDTRIARLIDSPDQAEDEGTLEIYSGGIRDA